MGGGNNNQGNRKYAVPIYHDGLEVVPALDDSDKQVTPHENLSNGAFIQLAVSKDDKEAYATGHADQSLPIPLQPSSSSSHEKFWSKRRWICAIILLLAVLVCGIAAGVIISFIKKREQSQRFWTSLQSLK